VELTSDGELGQQDYQQHACRGTYTLHSLYLLLWANFGSLCMALLTQQESGQRLHHIISEKPSVQSYCVKQLKNVWNLMCHKMGLMEEQRTSFIMGALAKFYHVCGLGVEW
jgi:hypothetical protein